MTYEEKVAQLERLKAEIAGHAQFLTCWDSAFLPSSLQRGDDDFEGADGPRAAVPLVIDEAEAQRLFPARKVVERIAAGVCRGRGGLPDKFVQLMYRAYRAGKSLAQVGKSFGRTRQSVHDTFTRRGLKLRKDSKAKARIEFHYRGENYAPGKGGYLRGTRTGRNLQRVIWEDFHGPLSRVYQVVFKDGNKRNFDLANLECVPATEVLARGRIGENGSTKARRLKLQDGSWKPKAPAEYDLWFLKWFSAHGWLIHDSPGGLKVWTNGDAVCRFRVNRLMIERLAAAGCLVAHIPPGDPFVTHWGLPERAGRAA